VVAVCVFRGYGDLWWEARVITTRWRALDPDTKEGWRKTLDGHAQRTTLMAQPRLGKGWTHAVCVELWRVGGRLAPVGERGES